MTVDSLITLCQQVKNASLVISHARLVELGEAETINCIVLPVPLIINLAGYKVINAIRMGVLMELT